MENLNNTNENLIEIRNLRFQIGDRWIFNGVDIDIPRGKITAFMGPGDTGKTTLLRLIGGKLYPESGSIMLDGKNIPELNRTALFSVRREMGMLGEKYISISVGGSADILNDGNEIADTQSALVLEDLISKVLTSIAGKKE